MAFGPSENMPEVEQRTQQGGRHEFRVQREIGGDEMLGPVDDGPRGWLIRHTAPSVQAHCPYHAGTVGAHEIAQPEVKFAK